MEQKQINVKFRNLAYNSISKISIYIQEQGYPIRAEVFADKLIDFGYSLSLYLEKYPICRQEKFSRFGFRCAVFKKNYVFIYRVVKSTLVIHNIINTKRLR